MADPLYSHDLPAKPSPQQQQARAYLLDLFRRGVPGQPTDDRQLQSTKFTGVVYTAIRPLMRAVRKADVQVLRRRPRRGRVTFGPGSTVAKSVAAGHGKSARDDYVPVEHDHPVCRVLDRPQQRDGSETIGDILEYLTLQGCLTGVSPLWAVPSKKYLESRGEYRPVQLYALPTALTWPQPVPSPEYPHGAYRITPYFAAPMGGGWGGFPGRGAGAAGTLLDAREVPRRLHKHPVYRWDGYSPLTACAFQLDLAEAVDQARRAAMLNMVNSDLIFLIPGADQEFIKSIREQIAQNNAGPWKNRGPLIVAPAIGGEGKAEVKPGSPTAREADFGNTWEQVQKAVLAVFGMPSELLYGTSNYSALYAAKKFYHENTVQPECEELGEFLTRAVADPWCEEPGELCVELVVPEPANEEQSVIAAKDLVALDLVTVNEARASQNLPPVAGGDVIPSVYKSKAGIAAGTAPDPTKPPPVPMGKPGKGDAAGGPPRPDNDAAEGSKPPMVPKAIPADTDVSDPAPYGFCPECRSPGVMAERRINGNARCANGHAYPRAKAKYASTQINLTGAAASKLRALGRRVADADLGDDGREDDPHVTVRYGLHAVGPAPVAAAVSGFGPVRYRLGRLSAFRGAESGKAYDVIFAEVESPDLHRLNAALGELPHTDTHAVYKPHATVAYVKAGLADKYLAALGAVDEDGAADAITFSTAAREHTTVPLSAAVAKAMNTMSLGDGGALVEPATVGVRRKPRRKVLRGAKARAAVAAIVRGV